jgi:hypothetical protein
MSGSEAIVASRAIANLCNTGACPTIYDSGPASVVVQGFRVPADRVQIDLPEGETLVEIPRELLVEALRNLS